MKLEDLKTGLFGYKKTNVFQLISAMEEDYSAKLMEMHKQAMKIEEQQLEKIRQLEEELKAARKQLKKLKSKQNYASIYSQQYIEPLKKEIDEKEHETQQMLNGLSGISQQELDAYQVQIQNIREMFHSLIVSMSNETYKSMQQREDSNISAPEHNMTLFSRKTESAE